MKRMGIKLVVLFGVLAGSAALGQSESSPKHTTTLHMIPAKQFCARMANSLAMFATQQGLDHREAQRRGSQSSLVILKQLQSMKLDPFLDVTTVSTKSEANQEKSWLSVPDLLISSLGFAPQRVLLVDRISDLRFTSHVMPGSQLLLLADDLGDLNTERIKLVSDAAISLGLKIHVLWVGRGADERKIASARAFAALAASTGGSIVDLSAIKSCE